MDKEKRKPKRHLEFTSSTDKKNHVRTFFNVKLCDTQQPIRYF